MQRRPRLIPFGRLLLPKPRTPVPAVKRLESPSSNPESQQHWAALIRRAGDQLFFKQRLLRCWPASVASVFEEWCEFWDVRLGCEIPAPRLREMKSSSSCLDHLTSSR